MKRSGDSRPFRTRLLFLAWLNSAIAIVVALLIWLSPARGNHHSLWDQLVQSFIHSTFYGFGFGLAMAHLGERLALLRVPWNWVSIVASLVLIALTTTMAVQLCLLGSGFLSVDLFWPEFLYKSLGVFIIALIIGLGIYTYETMRDRIQATSLQLRTQELEKERALKLITEARLSSLESKLHPHFLFNTLNAISALIPENQALADEMLQRLAALLRRSLDACEQERVTLGEEASFVADYLEIEKARFGDRLAYSIDLEPGLASLAVPPLTLQPLVENSIKFAVLPSPNGGKVRVKAWLRSNRLTVEVWDDGPGFTADVIPRGHGLDNLRLRLISSFGDEATLSVTPQDVGVTVAVCIPTGNVKPVA